MLFVLDLGLLFLELKLILSCQLHKHGWVITLNVVKTDFVHLSHHATGNSRPLLSLIRSLFLLPLGLLFLFFRHR